jgi:Pectate lyase superfamily protein
MNRNVIVTSRWFEAAILMVFLGCVAGLPGHAQVCSPVPATAGNNTVYETCSGSVTKVGSSAYIDASAYDSNTSHDICARINNALLSSGFKGGTVIDARGINPGTTQSCASNPFVKMIGPPPTFGPPSTVLLPSGTITMSTAWVVPDQTQIVGEGPGHTILQAVSSGFTDADPSPNTAMLHMGLASSGTITGAIVFAVRMSHLTLDGNGLTIDGIDNVNAEELSYVDDVTIQNIKGTGLYLGIDPGNTGTGRNLGAADHSGPYSNITFLSGTAISGTVCVNIASGTQPRGIHGITCQASTTPTTAIILDGGNTTIENARIDGFQDGILIGANPTSQGPSQANLLFNIVGTNSVGNTNNLIHISKPASSPPNNITIVGATSAVNTTIQDDLTSTTLTFLSDPYVGMYIVGHPIFNTSGAIEGYSRFTTSPRFSTWVAGNTSGGISGSCSNGTLFSSTTGTGGTLWACVSNGWSKIQ